MLGRVYNAFCRRYNIETKRFSAVKDEDYEYSY